MLVNLQSGRDLEGQLTWAAHSVGRGLLQAEGFPSEMTAMSQEGWFCHRSLTTGPPRGDRGFLAAWWPGPKRGASRELSGNCVIFYGLARKSHSVPSLPSPMCPDPKGGTAGSPPWGEPWGHLMRRARGDILAAATCHTPAGSLTCFHTQSVPRRPRARLCTTSTSRPQSHLWGSVSPTPCPHSRTVSCFISDSAGNQVISKPPLTSSAPDRTG